MSRELIGLSLVALVLLSVAVIGLAQTDFEGWKEQRQRKLDQFKRERDRRFHRFLKERWRKMKLLKGRVEDTAPKPGEIPEASGQQNPPSKKIGPDQQQFPEEEEKPEKSRKQEKTLRKSPAPKKTEVQEETRRIQLDFFGHRLPFEVAPEWTELSLGSVDRDGIAAFWKDFAGVDFKPLEEQIRRTRSVLELDDWGELLLVNRLTRKFYDNSNVARLAAWGILLRRGHRVRVGYADQEIFLLYATENRVYQVSYFNLDGTRFYVSNLKDEPANPGALQTYKNNFEGGDEKLNFTLDNPVFSAEHGDTRELSFEFEGKKYKFRIPVNHTAVEYYGMVPQLELTRYFQHRRAANSVTRLVEALKSEARGMKPKVALNFLLRFVQNAFKYRTDSRQFGEENYLLPAETLYYPYSDCEDRALLFSHLVRKVLGRRVIGLDFPGHVAAAVEFSRSPTGYYFMVEKQPFVVTDPTYINAGPGELMPEFVGREPRLIF